MSFLFQDFDLKLFGRRAKQHMTAARFLTAEAALGRKPLNARYSQALNGACGRMDIIGDVHACFDELRALLGYLGWQLYDTGPQGPIIPCHEDPGRQLVFLGDLVSGGKGGLSCLRLLLGAVQSDRGFTLLGNHDWNILALSEGLVLPNPNRRMDHCIAALRASPLKSRIVSILKSMPDEIRFEHPSLGSVLLVHAAPSELSWILGPQAPRYDDYIRTHGYHHHNSEGAEMIDWRHYYSLPAWVIFGHQPFSRPMQRGKTLGIDLGQSFGGGLCALQLDRAVPGAPLRKAIVMGPARPKHCVPE